MCPRWEMRENSRVAKKSRCATKNYFLSVQPRQRDLSRIFTDLLSAIALSVFVGIKSQPNNKLLLLSSGVAPYQHASRYKSD
jgi:hypothetical protein